MTLVIITALEILMVSGFPAKNCYEMARFLEARYEVQAYCTAEWDI